MPKNKVNVRPTVVEDVLPSELDLNWSLSPLVKGWMRLIAIDPIAPKNKWHWLLWMAHRLLCFTFTVGINAYVVFSFYSETTFTEFFSTNKPTKTSQWNTWIDYVNTAIHAVSVHLYLLLLFPKKWNRLKESLDNAEYQLSFPQTSSSLNTIYQRFRNISRVSIALIVLLEGSVIFTLFIFAWLSDHRWKQVAFDSVALFCGVYASSCRILFSVLCRLIADHFKMIEQQMEGLTTRNDGSQFDHSVYLKKLQHQHALVCRSVDHMNSSFGLFLLLDILYFFISFTVYAMYFLVFSINGNSRQWGESMIIIAGFFYNLTSLAITCFSSNLILKQANRLIPAVYQLSQNMQPSLLEQQIHAFAAQMSQMSPQIDALGFFNVNLHIFPTLLGTTLTYFFIMFQFYWDEYNTHQTNG